MRSFTAGIVMACLCSCTPNHADESSDSNGASGEATVADISIDGFPVYLGTTSLPAIQAMLGGDISTQGQTGSAVEILCFRFGSTTVGVTFESSVLARDTHAVTAATLGDVGADPKCARIDMVADRLEINGGLRLGMSRAALLAQLGHEPQLQTDSIVEYTTETINRSNPDIGPLYTTRGVRATIADGVVVAVLLWKTTTT